MLVLAQYIANRRAHARRSLTLRGSDWWVCQVAATNCTSPGCRQYGDTTQDPRCCRRRAVLGVMYGTAHGGRESAPHLGFSLA